MGLERVGSKADGVTMLQLLQQGNDIALRIMSLVC